MHLASRLGVKNDKSFQTAYWKAFNDFFGPTNAPVIKAMLIARHVKVDTGNADLDRVCFGLRETMSWLAEAIELAELAKRSKVLAVVGTQATASPEVELVRKIVADGFVLDVGRAHDFVR